MAQRCDAAISSIPNSFAARHIDFGGKISLIPETIKASFVCHGWLRRLIPKNRSARDICLPRTSTMKFRFPWSQDKYALLQDEDIQSPGIHTQATRITLGSLAQILFVLALCIGSSLAGFIIRGWLDDTHGQPMIESRQIPPSLRPVGSVAKTFQFNDIYSAPPSNVSNGAWAKNLPRKYTLIYHQGLEDSDRN